MVEMTLHPLITALEEPQAKQKFGKAIETADFVVSIADQPIGVSVPAIFEKLGQPVPPEIDLYRRFGVWLVPNRVNITRRKGLREVTSVGIECEYLNAPQTCSTVALIPAPQFITIGGVAGGFTCSGSFSPAGEALASGATGDGTLDVFGLSIAARTGGSVSASFHCNVVTPVISAVGIGSSRAEWAFTRHEQALFGRDLQTWSTVVLPKRQRTLTLRMRAYITTRIAFVPSRHQSDWETITCDLGGF